jgi:DNA repair exonuclease SbcCD ATPase subunit
VGAFEAASRRRADLLASTGKAARTEFATVQSQHRRAVERAEVIRAQQAAAPDTTFAREQLAERIRNEAGDIGLMVELPRTASEALLFQTSVAELGDELARIDTGFEEWRREEESLAAAGQVRDEAAALADYRDQVRAAAQSQEADQVGLAAAEERLTEALNRSEALVALAHRALPLLGERCPVCEQQINRGHVEQHLADVLTRGREDITGLEEDRDRARDKLETSSARYQEMQAVLVGFEELRLRRSRHHNVYQEILGNLRAIRDRGRRVGLELASAEDLIRSDGTLLRRTVDALRAVWRLTGELVSVLRSLPIGDELAGLEAEVQRLELALNESREATVTASAREEEARVLQRAATRSATAVADVRFRLLAPLISDIFLRLDPHPIFKTLDFSLGVYRERGVATPVVRDDELSVEADPLVVFSSSQANVAALSYFLALGWAAGREAMPFVLLDDPLQSLDDVNALAFADLCRHIRRQRQLIVSTHDPRLASLLERKLAPRAEGETTRVVGFTAWTKRGPELELRTVPSQVAEGRDRRLVASAAA